MNRKLKSDCLELLAEVISERCPDILPQVQGVAIYNLGLTERKRVVDALADELRSNCVGANGEPNSRGILLDRLIGFLEPLDAPIGWKDGS